MFPTLARLKEREVELQHLKYEHHDAETWPEFISNGSSYNGTERHCTVFGGLKLPRWLKILKMHLRIVAICVKRDPNGDSLMMLVSSFGLWKQSGLTMFRINLLFLHFGPLQDAKNAQLRNALRACLWDFFCASSRRQTFWRFLL